MATTTTIENLPYEVISDIFIRLLSKQLAQMKSLCKPWNALLSDSSFIKSHLHHSIHHKDEILLFFPMERGAYTTRPTSSPDLDLTNLIKLQSHSLSKYIRREVIGSVNGLVCFHNPYDYDAVEILNLSLSARVTLPPCSSPSAYLDLGFGFDPKSDDYKVVSITTSSLDTLLQAEVYSMRKGSWKSISQTFRSHDATPYQNKVCVEGHLHWCADTYMDQEPAIIVAFDLGAETFCEMSLPDPIQEYFNVLGVLGGKLCVMSFPSDGECPVWVMDEYGVAESWVKRHSFSQFGNDIWFLDIFPNGFTSRSELLFRYENSKGYGLYNPVTSKTKIFKIRRSYVIEYVDSLVWITPAKQTPAKQLQFEEVGW